MKQIVITVILCATALIALRIAVPKPEQKLSVIEAIHSRRSIREYKETPVEREKLLAVAKAGIAAPNAMNRQAWALRVVDSKEWIDACTAVYVETIKGTPMGDHLLVDGFKNMFRNAPAVIFIAHKPGPCTQVDCGLMAGNMVLSAKSLGLGSIVMMGPLGFFSRPEGEPFLKSLGLSEGYQLLLCVGVGYADEEPAARPRNKEVIKYVE